MIDRDPDPMQMIVYQLAAQLVLIDVAVEKALPLARRLVEEAFDRDAHDMGMAEARSARLGSTASQQPASETATPSP